MQHVLKVILFEKFHHTSRSRVRQSHESKTHLHEFFHDCLQLEKQLTSQHKSKI
jgi:hypothetical protein